MENKGVMIELRMKINLNKERNPKERKLCIRRRGY